MNQTWQFSSNASHAFLGALPHAAGVVDADGTLVAANRLWSETDTPLASVLREPGPGYLDALAAGGPKAVELLQTIQARLQTNTPTPSEPILSRGSTDPHRAWETYVGCTGPARVLVTHIDVSDAHRTRADLHQSRARLRTIVTGAPLALFAVDLGGRFSLVEGLGVGANGLFGADLVGRSVDATYAHLPELVGAIRSAIAGTTTQVTVELGALAFEVRCSPDRDRAGSLRGAVGVATDVTQRVRAQRMKDDFVSIVNHELRTPLTSIHGSLSLLENSVAGPLPPDAMELTKIARTSVDRLIRLITDLLDLDRMDSGRFELHRRRLDLGGVVKAAATELQGLATDADVVINISGCRAVDVDADPDRIHQVITNLIANALKYSPAGRSVVVRSHRTKSGVARVSVADEGPGIAQADQERLFEKFSQLPNDVNRARGGSGLGLAISRAIVGAHGGRLSLDSQLGAGSTFYFELPLSRRAATAVDSSIRPPTRAAQPPSTLSGGAAWPPETFGAPNVDPLVPPTAGIAVLLELFSSPGDLRDAHAQVQLLLARLTRNRSTPKTLTAVTKLRTVIERELDAAARGIAPDFAALASAAAQAYETAQDQEEDAR